MYTPPQGWNLIYTSDEFMESGCTSKGRNAITNARIALLWNSALYFIQTEAKFDCGGKLNTLWFILILVYQ